MPEVRLSKKTIETYLEDEEDYTILVAAYEEYLRTGRKTHSLEEIKAEFGLD